MRRYQWFLSLVFLLCTGLCTGAVSQGSVHPNQVKPTPGVSKPRAVVIYRTPPAVQRELAKLRRQNTTLRRQNRQLRAAKASLVTKERTMAHNLRVVRKMQQESSLHALNGKQFQRGIIANTKKDILLLVGVNGQYGAAESWKADMPDLLMVAKTLHYQLTESTRQRTEYVANVTLANEMDIPIIMNPDTGLPLGKSVEIQTNQEEDKVVNPNGIAPAPYSRILQLPLRSGPRTRARNSWPSDKGRKQRDSQAKDEVTETGRVIDQYKKDKNRK